MDELLLLRLRLQRARERRDSQPAFSPDWDAAMADIEDLTDRVWRYVSPAKPQPVTPRP